MSRKKVSIAPPRVFSSGQSATDSSSFTRGSRPSIAPSFVRSISIDQSYPSDTYNAQNQKFSFCSRLKYRRALNGIQKSCKNSMSFCNYIGEGFEKINKELSFPILPDRFENLTHASAKLWICTYGIMEISSELTDEDVNELNRCFAMVIYQAELTEGLVNNLTNKISELAHTSAERIEKMRKNLDDCFPGYEIRRNTVFEMQRTKFKPVKEHLLTGSKLHAEGNLGLIKLFMRTNDKRKWFRFTLFSPGTRFEVITKGLLGVCDSLKEIRVHIQNIIDFLSRKHDMFHNTIDDSLNLVETQLMTLIKFRELFRSNFISVANLLKKTEGFFNSMLLVWSNFSNMICEINGMSCLCFAYCSTGLKLKFKPYRQAIREIYKNYAAQSHGRATVEQWLTFESPNEEFYKTRYTDILRKIPVLVSLTQLCLHKYTQVELDEIHSRDKEG